MNDYFIFLEAPVSKEINDNYIKILENANNNPAGKTIIRAILQDVGNKNRNGRIYAPEDMKRVITCQRISEQLAAFGLKGEAGHPLSKEPGRQTTIDPAKVSHRIMNLRIEGSYIVGDIMASGPYGRYFEEDIIEGELPAFSFRGVGTIEVRGGLNYAKVTTPVAWDRVYYPSHKCAYMTNTINESVSLDTLTENTDDNFFIMNESQMFKIDYNEKVEKFIKDESKRLKRISESLDMSVNQVQYNNLTNTVTISENTGSKVIFKLEDYVRHQIIL